MLVKPVIMLVDDEPQTLTALLNALARRFSGDYQVVSHLSATTALKDLDRVKTKGGQIALVIADLRMPEMPGIEFLKRERRTTPSHAPPVGADGSCITARATHETYTASKTASALEWS